MQSLSIPNKIKYGTPISWAGWLEQWNIMQVCVGNLEKVVLSLLFFPGPTRELRRWEWDWKNRQGWERSRKAGNKWWRCHGSMRLGIQLWYFSDDLLSKKCFKILESWVDRGSVCWYTISYKDDDVLWSTSFPLLWSGIPWVICTMAWMTTPLGFNAFNTDGHDLLSEKRPAKKPGRQRRRRYRMQAWRGWGYFVLLVPETTYPLVNSHSWLENHHFQ